MAAATLAPSIFNDRRGAARGSRTTQFQPVAGGAPKPNDPAMGVVTGGGPKKPGQATRERANRMRSTHQDVQAGRAVVVTPFSQASPAGSRTISPTPTLNPMHTRAAIQGRPSALYGLGAPAGAGGGMVGHANASHAGFFDFSGGVNSAVKSSIPTQRRARGPRPLGTASAASSAAPKPYKPGVIDKLANRFMKIKPIGRM